MKKWVVKKNGKYLEYDDLDPTWTKDINKAFLYATKEELRIGDDEEAVRVEISVKEIK